MIDKYLIENEKELKILDQNLYIIFNQSDQRNQKLIYRIKLFKMIDKFVFDKMQILK